MGSSVFGGGVIFVVAAVLWAAVLVPGWMRRREFRAAEQNALRLQRTLRVLAETAEVPAEVRVEATAREALAQERLLRNEQRRKEAERKAKLEEVRAAEVRAQIKAQQMRRKQADLVRAAKLRRPWVRRVRSTAALVCAVSLVSALIGVGLVLAGVGAFLLFVSLGCLTTATAMLLLLAPGRAKHVDISAEKVTPRVPERQEEPAAETVVVSEDPAAAAHAAAQAAAAARIDRARALARARSADKTSAAMQNQPQSILLEQARAQLRADRARAAGRVDAALAVSAEASTPATAITNGDLAGADAAISDRYPAERLRRMGIVGDTSEGSLDVDAVLRERRRAS